MQELHLNHLGDGISLINYLKIFLKILKLLILQIWKLKIFERLNVKKIIDIGNIKFCEVKTKKDLIFQILFY